MRAFGCPRCGQLVYFENVECLRCGAGLGFDPKSRQMVRVAGDAGDDGGGGEAAPYSGGGGEAAPYLGGGGDQGAGATPVLPAAGATPVLPAAVRCANRFLAGCNWVLPRSQPGALCRSCRLTRTRPSDTHLARDPQATRRFVRTEAAKRRLVFQLLELGLPLVSRHEDTESGLAFDFLVKQADPITIGHADGVITIDLAESDDAYRERMRVQLGEPYRTMLGHLRHEVGHYYWQVIVSENTDELDGFRRLFGDERADYQQALERHYDHGPAPGWAAEHVSVYASAHPWEDWAETWAHYLHICDTLQTAASHGVIVTGPHFTHRPFATRSGRGLDPSLTAAPSLESHQGFDELLADWLPLTYALNAINRSMGKDDLYPFVLSPKVIERLRLVHDQVRRSGVSVVRPAR